MAEIPFIFFIFIGFTAQLIDSSLGMGFGTLSSSLLLAFGFPPSAVSATIHTAEIFSGGGSAFSHYKLGNIDRELLKKLIPTAALGALLGSVLMIYFPANNLKYYLAVYFLVMGIIVLLKAINKHAIAALKIKRRLLGFFGGFFDAFCGAGWGEFVSSGLLIRGQDTRSAVGTLNTAEFLITIIISAAFMVSGGFIHWEAVAGVSLGGLMAAPLGAWACKKLPADILMAAVGITIIILSIKALI